MGDKWGWVWISKTLKGVFFGKFGLSGFWCNAQNQRFVTSILLYKCFVFDWVLDGGIRTCNGWGVRVWILSRMKKKYHFLDYLDCHESAAWIKTKQFLIELSSAKVKFWMETFVGQIISVVTEKYEY